MSKENVSAVTVLSATVMIMQTISTSTGVGQVATTVTTNSPICNPVAAEPVAVRMTSRMIRM